MFHYYLSTSYFKHFSDAADKESIPILIVIIVFFLAGTTLVKYLDLAYRHIDTGSAVSPAIFVLFTTADLLQWYSPGTRWSVLFVVFASAMVNGVSMDGRVTSMVTGHLVKLSSDASLMLFDGKLSRAQSIDSLQSLGIVTAFCAGVYLAMLALSSSYFFALYPFTSIGAAYCAIFVTNDRLRRRRQKHH